MTGWEKPTQKWEEISQDAARGNIKEFRSLAGNRVQIATKSYYTIGDGVDFLEDSLHDLWQIYYQAGRHVSHESPENDRLVLVSDMVDFWVNGDRLCQIALLLLRATLENRERDLRNENERDDKDPMRSLNRLSIANLLPSIHNDCPNVVRRGGRLFEKWKIAQQPQSRFTPWRWMFWLKRLHEIKKEASRNGDKKLEDLAGECIESMMFHTEERNPHVLRVYGAGGSELHEDAHLVCLKRLCGLDNEGSEGEAGASENNEDLDEGEKEGGKEEDEEDEESLVGKNST
ncbi:hypothetical protein BJX64DRAFT_284503 [Aspergillus heterothallicus]